LVAYKTSQVELDWKEFDPYFELEIDRVSNRRTGPDCPLSTTQ